MNKIALVIGVKEYEHLPSLWNTENDASDISDFLKSVGFETTLLLNPSLKELITVISEFKAKVKDNTASLIYFAGHGLQLEGHNFLIPKDAELKISQEIPYFCVHASDCLVKDNNPNSIHILILDACRNNPFQNGLRGVSGGLAKMEAPVGTLIAFSTSPNSVSIERNNDRNGVYTSHLLEHIRTANLSLERIFKNTRTDVIKSTEGRQVPWEESSLHGEDFYFIKKQKALEFIVKKDLVFAYKALTEETFDFSNVETTDKISIPYSKAIKLLKEQYEKHKDTPHPSYAFIFILNLQKVIYATYVFTHLVMGIDFKKLNATVLEHSKELTEEELSLYHKVLLSMEHFASIFAHNDKFGNLKTIERGYQDRVWKGFKMKGNILETQNDFLEDMKYIQSQEKHLNEFFTSELLIDIMDKFFEIKTSHNIGIAKSGAGH